LFQHHKRSGHIKRARAPASEQAGANNGLDADGLDVGTVVTITTSTTATTLAVAATVRTVGDDSVSQELADVSRRRKHSIFFIFIFIYIFIFIQ